MIELDSDQLMFRFPEVHADALCRIEFQRTLRIPDDNREHYLPPGLGRFSMSQVDDYSGQVPDAWCSHGGVFLPMYQAEALTSYIWKVAAYGSYLENLAVTFLGAERIYRVTFPKFGSMLRDVYGAADEVMQVFDEHEEADAGHVQQGISIIETHANLSEESCAAIERALRMTLLFHERWHDGLLEAYGG